MSEAVPLLRDTESLPDNDNVRLLVHGSKDEMPDKRFVTPPLLHVSNVERSIYKLTTSLESLSRCHGRRSLSCVWAA